VPDVDIRGSSSAAAGLSIFIGVVNAWIYTLFAADNGTIQKLCGRERGKQINGGGWSM